MGSARSAPCSGKEKNKAAALGRSTARGACIGFSPPHAAIEPNMNRTRSPLSITLAVWHALLLRESLSRLFARRAAWAWLLLEPAAHMAFLVFVFTVIRVRHVGGIETGLWLILGLMSFFLFRRTGTQAANAIGANRSLFVYRQVKPIDSILVRSFLEGLLTLIVAFLILSACALAGINIVPADPIGVIIAALGLWLLGLGFGLIVSVAKEMIEELENIIGIVMLPMYLASGVLMPISSVPYPYREWLMLNPVAHGIEAVRLGFAPYYHSAPELSVCYIYYFAFTMVFFGLVLQARFAERMIAK